MVKQIKKSYINNNTVGISPTFGTLHLHPNTFNVMLTVTPVLLPQEVNELFA